MGGLPRCMTGKPWSNSTVARRPVADRGGRHFDFEVGEQWRQTHSYAAPLGSRGRSRSPRVEYPGLRFRRTPPTSGAVFMLQSLTPCCVGPTLQSKATKSLGVGDSPLFIRFILVSGVLLHRVRERLECRKSPGGMTGGFWPNGACRLSEYVLGVSDRPFSGIPDRQLSGKPSAYHSDGRSA
jgi:hypothetical protein